MDDDGTPSYVHQAHNILSWAYTSYSIPFLLHSMSWMQGFGSVLDGGHILLFTSQCYNLCSSWLFHRTRVVDVQLKKGGLSSEIQTITQILAWELSQPKSIFYLRPKDPTCASWSSMSGNCLISLSKRSMQNACYALHIKLDDVRASPTMHF
jgi:hypothetical protein